MSREAKLKHARDVLGKAEIPVTKKPAPVTKTKRGRPRLGDKPMTAAERMRRYRAKKAPLP
jgi:hypothetical protein